jgi:hypothetical protein
MKKREATVVAKYCRRYEINQTRGFSEDFDVSARGGNFITFLCKF